MYEQHQISQTGINIKINQMSNPSTKCQKCQSNSVKVNQKFQIALISCNNSNFLKELKWKWKSISSNQNGSQFSKLKYFIES